MTHAYAPCDDCGKPTRVPDDHPVDYAYCGCDTPRWPPLERPEVQS